MVTRFSVLAPVLLAVVQAACSTSHRDTPCLKNQPAFHLELTAVDGELPDDTVLILEYEGRLSESYSLAAGGDKNFDLCCLPGEPVKGALPDVHCGPRLVVEASVPPSLHDATAPPALDSSVPPVGDARAADTPTPLDGAPRPSGPTAIHCSIWTDNVADVKVKASGYPTYRRAFEAFVRDSRCIETTDERVTLFHGEGGM